jgi:hypothetical protein
MGSIIFVHGTGVRRQDFDATYALIAKNVTAFRLPVDLRKCFWGADFGTRLRAGGASIPGYLEKGGKGLPLGGDPADEEVALWSLLYYDPLYELRLLANALPKSIIVGFQEPPGADLRDRIEGFEASPELMRLLAAAELLDVWAEAYRYVSESGECAEALETISDSDAGHRTAIVRAIVAKATILAIANGAPAPDGVLREEILDHIVEGLGGGERGISTWFKQQAKTLALNWLTGQGDEIRGALSDRAFANAGDVLLYQARGEDIRRFIRDEISRASAPVTLLAHSLGGIACVDLLAMEHIPKVKLLITAGSQAPFLYEIDSLVSLRFGTPLPPLFPDWLNFYDPRDFLSYIGAGVFKNRVNDFELRSNQPFPESHGAYWANPVFWQTLEPFLP